MWSLIPYVLPVYLCSMGRKQVDDVKMAYALDLMLIVFRWSSSERKGTAAFPVLKEEQSDGEVTSFDASMLHHSTS